MIVSHSTTMLVSHSTKLVSHSITMLVSDSTKCHLNA